MRCTYRKQHAPRQGAANSTTTRSSASEVHDENAGSLGKVTGIVDAGTNKLLVIHEGDKEVLIPVNGPFITSINKSKKKISVDLPEGFLDI